MALLKTLLRCIRSIVSPKIEALSETGVQLLWDNLFVANSCFPTVASLGPEESPFCCCGICCKSQLILRFGFSEIVHTFPGDYSSLTMVPSFHFLYMFLFLLLYFSVHSFPTTFNLSYFSFSKELFVIAPSVFYFIGLAIITGLFSSLGLKAIGFHKHSFGVSEPTLLKSSMQVWFFSIPLLKFLLALPVHLFIGFAPWKFNQPMSLEARQLSQQEQYSSQTQWPSISI